jgi:hypothetical protein
MFVTTWWLIHGYVFCFHAISNGHNFRLIKLLAAPVRVSTHQKCAYIYEQRKLFKAAQKQIH